MARGVLGGVQPFFPLILAPYARDETPGTGFHRSFINEQWKQWHCYEYWLCFD